MPLLEPETAISHASAAIIHGLPLRPDEDLVRVQVTRADGGKGRRGAFLHNKLCRYQPDEVEVIGGYLVTTLARTAVDLCRTMPPHWSVAAADAALKLGVGPEELSAALERWPRRPFMRRARRAIAFGDARSGSVGESISRAVFRDAGLPQPELQFEITDGARLLGITDFAWPEQRVVGEFDGLEKYGMVGPGETFRDVIQREKRREERIRAAGWWVVRWIWADLARPQELAARVRSSFRFAPAA